MTEKQPFYAVCKQGRSGGLQLSDESRSLEEVKAARKKYPEAETAIYHFTWGEIPKFIEGTVFKQN